MDYGTILSRAWKITWNNKILWIFGFLAGSSSGSANFRLPSSSFQGGPGGEPEFELPPALQRQLERPETLAIILGVAGLLVVIALVFIVLSLIARSALIGGIRLADDNGNVAFGEAWQIGLRYFWRTLGLTLLLIAPALLIGLLGVGFGILTAGLGLVCLLPIVCVLALAYIPYGLVVWLGQFGIVLEDLSVMDALRRGWELLKNNVGPVIILALILFVGGLILGFVLLLPAAAVIIPVVFAFVSDPRNPNVPMLIGAGAAFLCLLPILWTINSVFNTWLYSAWTLTYRQMIGGAPALAEPPAPTPYVPA